MDVHALRHTFGTMLSRAGVPLQLIQKAMRHSDPKLTMGTYIHLELIDVAGAVANLPTFKSPEKATDRMAANAGRSVALPVALPLVKTCVSMANADKTEGDSYPGIGVEYRSQVTNNDSAFHPVASADKGEKWSGRLDLNQRPLDPQSSALNRTALRPDR